jgi:hypothetical protein
MRKAIFLSMAVILILALGMTPGYAQHMGMMGPGYGYQQDRGQNYCPYCGRYLGPGGGYGMMGPGYGYGPGMMGPGYGMGPGMMGPAMDTDPNISSLSSHWKRKMPSKW